MYFRIVVVDCNITIDGSLWRTNSIAVLLTVIEGLFDYDEQFRRKTSNGEAVLGFLLMQLGTCCILSHMYGDHDPHMVVIVFRYYYYYCC